MHLPRQYLLFVQGRWIELPDYIPTRKPTKVWTMLRYTEKSIRPPLPQLMVHGATGFIEDEGHDYAFNGRTFRYFSRARDKFTWVLFEYEYSFCESIHAGGNSKWHLRELTSVGKKLGGGITTPSLCEIVKHGWDLSVSITDFHLENNTCTKCKLVYLGTSAS